MIEYRKEKNKNYRVHLLERWFPLTRLTVPAIIGTFSITSTQSKQRWMLARDAFDYGAGWVTPTDISRDYLHSKYGKQRRRIGTMQYQNFYGERRHAPLAAEPMHLEYAYYVDIKSAYWTILKAIGWDVDYMPNKWIRVLSDMNDFPFPDIKMARNCLVSVAADGATRLRIWTGEELSFKKAGNPLVNKMLWSIVMDVLNGVAYEAIQAGAIYSYTDGFIVSHDRLEAVQNVIRSWGFVDGIKAEGETDVQGAGAYKIGTFQTKKYGIGKPRPIYKIKEDVNTRWLKPRFSKLCFNRS